MTITELIDKGEKELIITRNYMTIVDKQKCSRYIIDECTYDDDGFIEVDRVRMNMYFDIEFIKNYTNIDVPLTYDDKIEFYDKVCEYNIIEYITDKVIDYKRFRDVLEQELQSMIEKNSVEALMSKIANKLFGGIDDIIGNISTKINEVNINEIVPKNVDMNRIIELVNKLK